jgi:hypothetical protein
MTEVLSEDRIAHAVADVAATRIVRKVIIELRRMPNMLSGHGSVLRTMWDEICVQRHEGHWRGWDAQGQVVRNLVLRELGKLAAYERDALWLRTDAGADWGSQELERRAEYPVFDPDIVDYITREYVYDEARRHRWTARVEAYIDAPSWSKELDL